MTEFPFPKPPVRRQPCNRCIDWTAELVDWLYACRAHGVAVTDLARAVECSPQTLFTVFGKDPRGVRPRRETPKKVERADFAVTPEEFAALGAGRAQDVRLRQRRAAEPIGPLTRLPDRPRSPGRAIGASEIY